MIESLITDRTVEDARRAKYLASLKWDEMTEAEKAEWSGNLKAAYNFQDLNRVENAVAYLAVILQVLPPELKAYAESLDVAWDSVFEGNYKPEDLNLETKTDWSKEDAPTKKEMERYLHNVFMLRNALNFSTDPLPSSMNDLTWQGANAIEQALKRLDAAITRFRAEAMANMENAAEAWYFSGDIYAGEV